MKFLLNAKLGLSFGLVLIVNLYFNQSFAANVTSSTSGNWSATAWPNTGRTGTITTSTASATITGSGTNFLNELSPGNIIKNTSNVVIGTVKTVVSATSLILQSNAASNNTNISYRSQGVGKIDVITISASHAITVDDTFEVASITFNAPNTTNSITFNDDGYLNVSGAVTMTNAASNDRFVALNINNGTMYVGSLSMNGSSNRRRSEVNIIGGFFDVTGNLTAANSAGCLFSITDTGKLVFGGTVDQDMTITAGSLSTVIYDGGSQTVKPTTYANLTLAGSGTKTVSSVTVNGICTLSGTATQSTTITYGTNAGIKFINTTKSPVTSTEWPATFDRLAGVTIGTGASITMNEAKTFGVSDPLIIEANGILNTGNFALNLSGDFVNNGTINAGSSAFTITGNATQNIGSFSTTGLVSVTKSGATATLTGNVSGAGLTINATNNGTLNFGDGNTHNFSGTFTRTAGAMLGGSSIINFTGSGSAVGATFTPETSTVRWVGAAQNVSGMDYYNIELGGTGAKSLSSLLTTVNNNFIMTGSATAALTVGLNIAENMEILGTAGFTAGAFALSIGDSLIIGDGNSSTFTISSSTGTKTFNSIIINAGGSFVNSANMAITVNGHLHNSGTFTRGTNTYTLAGSSKEISGTVILSNTAISGSYTNLGSLEFTAAPTGAGSLTNGTTGTLDVNYTGAFGFSNLTASAVGNTVNYKFAGAQTVHATNYHHLTLSTSGAKTLQAGTTFIAGDFNILNSASTSAVVGLDINGDFNLSNTASFTASTFTHTIAGDINIANGTTASLASGTITLDGTTQSFTNSNASATTFNNLTLSNGEKTFTTNVLVNGALTISSGSKFVYGNSTSLQLAGTIAGTGTIKAKSCGNANNTLALSGTASIGNINFEPGFEHISALNITKTAGSVMFNSDVAINGVFTLPGSGTFVASFNGNVNFYGSSFSISNVTGRITMSANSSITIGACNTAGNLITIPNGIFTTAPTIKSLTLNRTNGFTLGNQMISLTDVLTLTAGTLTTNANLTLVSNASGTARVAPVTGAISGNVTAERFIPGGNGKRKWRFLSSPVNVSGSIALSQFQDDIFVTAPAQAAGGFDVNPFSSNASIRTYTESVSGSLNNGWTNPTNITNTISTGQGVEVFVRGSRALANPYLNWTTPDNVTIDYIGALNTGPFSPSITFTNTGSGTNDGFNLVGNPYASPINFDTTGWTKTNIQNKYWAYNPNTTLYGAYNAATGESTNSMTKYISSGQAFFVRATSASPVLTFTENVKSINAGNNYYRPSSAGKFPVLKITLTNDSADTDETLIILDPQSTFNGDDESDMFKFYNDALNLYTLAKDNSVLSMNAIPSTNNNDTIKMPVWSYDSSSISTTHHVLNFSRFESINSDIHIYLIDQFLNTTTDIRTNSEYHFMITTDANSYGNNRFKIVFSPTVASTTNKLNSDNKLVVYPNPTQNDLYVQLVSDNVSSSNGTYAILDLTGRVVEQGDTMFENNIAKISVTNLINGTYLIRLSNNGETSIKKFIKQ